MRVEEIIMAFLCAYAANPQALTLVKRYSIQRNRLRIIAGTQSGETALMIAAMRGHIDVIKVLLEYKANVNHRTSVRVQYVKIS